MNRNFTSGFSLPLFLTPENKYVFGLLMFTLASALYLASNHFPIFEPRMLPMSAIDLNVPFIPQTVWIYVSEYIYFSVIYIVCKDMANVNKYLYSFFSLQTISVLIFWLWPTTYPRELFPLPSDLDPVTSYVFHALRQSDTPNNCCPSLHVSSVYLSSFIFLDEQRKKLPIFFVWGTAIALSTLTTKQHYFIDLVTGLFLAAATYLIFHRCIQYRSVDFEA